MTVRSSHLMAAVLCVAVPTLGLAKTKPQPCPDARYLVMGERLVAGAATVDVDAVTVQGAQVGIDSGCPLSAGKVKATRKGTQVKGKWTTCGQLAKVRLTALIAPDCSSMTGTRKAKKSPPVTFSALLSTCGDGLVDVGEDCDGNTCPDGRACTLLCECPPPLPASTTTTTRATTSTSTSSTSTTSAPAATTSTTTTSTSTTSSTTLVCTNTCGNNSVEPCETCDDGNTDDNDGCPSDCTVDPCPAVVGGAPFTVTVSFSPLGETAAVALLVDFPEGKVNLPGTGGSVPAGTVQLLPQAAGSSGGTNNLVHALRQLVASSDPFDGGDLFRVNFRVCTGAPAPGAGEFSCRVLEATDKDGIPVATPTTCSVRLP